MTIAFTRYTAETAPEASRPILGAVKSAFSFIPNLQATMAESPELLAGYTALWDLVHKTSLTATEQQVVFMTANYENECQYCMAGHTTLARMQKIAEPIIAALRDGGTIPDAKLQALHAFAGAVVRQRGHLDDAQIQAFLDAGYTHRQVLDVVLIVGTKTLSNYTNHLTGTPLDAFMQGSEWNRPALAA